MFDWMIFIDLRVGMAEIRGNLDRDNRSNAIYFSNLGWWGRGEGGKREDR